MSKCRASTRLRLRKGCQLAPQPTNSWNCRKLSRPRGRKEDNPKGGPARQLFVEAPWFEEEGRLGRRRAAREQVEGEVDWALQGLTGFDFERERVGTGVLRLSSAIYGPVDVNWNSAPALGKFHTRPSKACLRFPTSCPRSSSRSSQYQRINWLEKAVELSFPMSHPRR